MTPEEIKDQTNCSTSPASMAAPGTHEAVYEMVGRYLPTGSLVADLAAGEGAFSIKLRELGQNVIAVDASSDHWKVSDIEHRVIDLDTEFAANLAGNEGRFDAVVAIEIIGLNMLASVNWSPIEFVRQLPWLSLDPPKPEYGISIPPLKEGGWWLMAGFFLTSAIFLWCSNCPSPIMTSTTLRRCWISSRLRKTRLLTFWTTPWSM